MKAVAYDQYGPPDVLRVVDIDRPTPRAHQLLIEVRASTVNRTDCAMLRATPMIMRLMTGLTKPKRPILGTAFAGIVVDRGAAVTEFAVGDRVFGFDDVRAGGFAEYMPYPADKHVALMPDGTSFEDAAAAIEGAHYAINFLNKLPGVAAGQRALVNGATGAVGCAMLQLLKHHAVTAVAVCEGKDAALVQQLGASEVIDFRCEDFTAIGARFDYVFDAVGKSSFGKCRRLLTANGIYVSSELGPWAQNGFYALVTPLRSGRTVKFPAPLNTRGSLHTVAGLMAAGEFQPVIDRRYVLDDVADAFRYVETEKKVGNVVVNIGPVDNS